MKSKKEESMQAKSHPTKQWLATVILQDARDFAALEDEWESLYEHCPSATPFQSWAWLYSWWEAYGSDYELRLIAVRNDENLLVGLAPLILDRRWGFGRLLFAGTGITDYLDVLARPGWGNAVAEAVSSALEQMSGWEVADLQELRPEAMAWALDINWSRPKVRLWQSNCPLMDIKPWDQMIMLLKKKRRSSARQAVRRSEEDGLHSRLVGAEDAERAARRLVALHQTSWRGRGIGVEHTRRRFEAFMEAAVRRMTYGGLGAISEFQRDGETALSHFAVFGRDFIGGYMHGPSQEAAARYQISSLIIWDMANIARDKNLPYLNHLRGEEPYKLRWSSRVVPNHRLIMSRNPTGLAIYSGYQTLRLKINAYVSSKEAPRWIGKSVVRYRNLRSEAARHVKGVSE